MRSLIKGAFFCLLVLFLVYCGLNAVGNGLAELTALETPPAAFALQLKPAGFLAVTFGGETVLLDPAALIGSFKEWWDRLGLF